jgi:hypothetical protein
MAETKTPDEQHLHSPGGEQTPLTFPWHMWLGVAMVAIGQIFIVTRIPPISQFYFAFIWYGYLLVVDGTIHRVGGASLLRRRPREFGLMILLGAAFWWIFELYNQAIQNWHYTGTAIYSPLEYVFLASLYFGVVLLAVWLTARLILIAMGWNDLRWIRVPCPARGILIAMSLLGVVFAVLPFLIPRYAFALTWVGIPLVLDPINFLRGRPSILGYVTRGRWGVPLALIVGGPITGFFWEFWNYWADPKWYYTVPFFDFWYLFEMPLPGYLGYIAFAIELFVLYHFVRPIFPGPPAVIDADV